MVRAGGGEKFSRRCNHEMFLENSDTGQDFGKWIGLRNFQQQPRAYISPTPLIVKKKKKSYLSPAYLNLKRFHRV